MKADREFDYIIVGAGSAGCVLAAELARASGTRILVLEAGSRDWSPWIHVPIGFFKTIASPKLNWGYEAEFDSSNEARRVPWPRGRVLGGSSSINGLVYIRGQAQDYDDWAASSASGWEWKQVRTYFEKIEASGLGVSPARYSHPLCDAFVNSAEVAGIPVTDDFNGSFQGGSGYYRLNTRGGLRSSSAVAFLHPAHRAGKISVATGCEVERIEVHRGRAIGLAYRRNGNRHYVAVAQEIVLCAGAIASPQILQCSGIGPAGLLKALDIPVLVDSPGVGQNLQDHFAVRVVARVSGSRTLNEMSRSWPDKIGMALQYACSRTGPLTLGAAMAGAFVASGLGGARPDLQFLFGPLSADNPALGLHAFPGMTLSVCQLRPESRGHLQIVSADIATKPRIVANYLATELDRQTLFAGVRKAREIYATAPLSRYVAEEFAPGVDIASDQDILQYARTKGGSIYHPVGTCRMGTTSDCVVDPELKVRGVDGLRVADASVMPLLPSGNTNASCMMIGARAAAIIRGEDRVPANA